MRKKPSRLKGEERKKQILRVALGLFAENGYYKTTTASIAKAAGVTEPVLYRHFDSKKDMFVTLVQKVHTEAEHEWQTICERETDPVERLRALVGRVCGHGRQPHSIMVWRSLLETDDDDVSEAARALLSARLQLLLHAVCETRDAGCLRPGVDPATLTMHLLNMEMGCLFTSHAFQQNSDGGYEENIWNFITPWITERPSTGATQAV